MSALTQGGSVVAGFAVVVALAILARRRQSRGGRGVQSNTARSCKAVVDGRILSNIREELGENGQLQSVLEFGGGCGARARLLAQTFNCRVLSVVSDPGMYHKAMEETKQANLTALVCFTHEPDFHLAPEPPKAVLHGQTFDCVIVSLKEAKNVSVLIWSLSSLRTGGVLIVEGNWATYHILRKELGLLSIKVCKGGMAESLEFKARYMRERIADMVDISDIVSEVYSPEPYLLVSCIKTSSNTEQPSSWPPSVTTPFLHAGTISTFEKPSVERLRDNDGRRLRVGCVCVMISRHNPSQLDWSRVVLVSSSKRAGEWVVPAGGLEFDEDLKTAAQREAFEESGAEGHIVATLNLDEDYRKRTVTQYFLLAAVNLSTDFPEIKQRSVVLMDIHDALLYVSNPASKNALSLAKCSIWQL